MTFSNEFMSTNYFKKKRGENHSSNRMAVFGSSMCIYLCNQCLSEPRSTQTKDYEIGICCFPVKHASLRCKSRDCRIGIRIMHGSGAIVLSMK